MARYLRRTAPAPHVVSVAHDSTFRDPLYDPKRDGASSPSTLTGQLMGDPPPGRRELLAKRRINEAF